MTEFWKIVITAAVSALVGVLAYIIKAEFDSKEDVKVSARLMAADIEKIQIMLEKAVKEKFIPFNNLSILTDWRKDFYNVNRKLDSDEAKSLLGFYAGYQRLTDAKERYIIIYSDDAKHVERRELSNQYMELSKHILKIDVSSIIERLENIGA